MISTIMTIFIDITIVTVPIYILYAIYSQHSYNKSIASLNEQIKDGKIVYEKLIDKVDELSKKVSEH